MVPILLSLALAAPLEPSARVVTWNGRRLHVPATVTDGDVVTRCGLVVNGAYFVPRAARGRLDECGTCCRSLGTAGGAR